MLIYRTCIAGTSMAMSTQMGLVCCHKIVTKESGSIMPVVLMPVTVPACDDSECMVRKLEQPFFLTGYKTTSNSNTASWHDSKYKYS